MASDDFAELVRGIQAGDAAAAETLIRRYQADIQREVRIRLRIQDGRVRRLLDSMDITQSVLAGFFVGVATGQFQPASPQQLLALLTAMVRNKLLKKVRFERQQRRDNRRAQSLGAAAHTLPAPDQTPSECASAQELLVEARKRLTPEEQQIAERRRQGVAWADIAAELGGSPDGRRKQLERAFQRVARQLGLDEEGSLEPVTPP